MIQEVLSLLLTLAAVVCVIILAYYGSKWYVQRMGQAGGGRHIKVVDRLVVSKTGSIVIIDVEGIQYMVGVSDANVQIMKQLEEPIPFKAVGELPRQNFLKALKAVIHKEKEDEQ